MESFSLHILGCGSAIPTLYRSASSQVLNLREKLYMVDCGEGAQLQLRKAGLRFSSIDQIFLSHLHGDHCFGLMGLLSTLGMLGRTQELVVHAHKDAETIFQPQVAYFCKDLPFPLRFNAVSPQRSECIFEDKALRVTTIPLKHRVPTCGFLFEEQPRERHMIGEMVAFYDIPRYAISRIRQGADFVTKSGETIPNERLTRAADAPRRYAYCSDTLFTRKVIPLIEGADLLYHEATFSESHAERARQTFHSTARQAAAIAREAGVKRLVIGHFSARYTDASELEAEARALFPETTAAREGARYDL